MAGAPSVSHGQGNGHAQLRASTGGRVDADRAAEGRQTLANPDEADALGGRPRRRAGIEADAVVPDGAADPPGFAADDDGPAEACACLFTLLSASWTMRYRTVSIAGERRSSRGPSTLTQSPVRAATAPARTSSAASARDRRGSWGAGRARGGAVSSIRSSSVFTDCSRAAAGAGTSRATSSSARYTEARS